MGEGGRGGGEGLEGELDEGAWVEVQEDERGEEGEEESFLGFLSGACEGVRGGEREGGQDEPERERRGRTWISSVARSTSSSRIRTSVGPVMEASTERGPATSVS